MRVFIIDYPDVRSSALRGIDKLTENDHVFIFYNSLAKKLTFDAMESIRRSNANIQSVDMGSSFLTKPLPIRIAATVGYYVGRDDCTHINVVSSRLAFEGLQNFCADMGLESDRISFMENLDYSSDMQDDADKYKDMDISE
ncbi:MAG: hypothetical protein IJO93_02495 [Clostridia bacterium]|nr:hypothetical protein [Clostridia bacterium]